MVGDGSAEGGCLVEPGRHVSGHTRQRRGHPLWRAGAGPAGPRDRVPDFAVGLGGPPLALLYRQRHSSEIRPTLAVVFGLGTVLSLATLGATGGFDVEDLRAGLALGGLNVVGMVLAAPALRRLHETVIRQGLLVWAFVGAVLALFRVVAG